VYVRKRERERVKESGPSRACSSCFSPENIQFLALLPGRVRARVRVRERERERERESERESKMIQFGEKENKRQRTR
jgi:hypothetical protein